MIPGTRRLAALCVVIAGGAAPLAAADNPPSVVVDASCAPAVGPGAVPNGVPQIVGGQDLLQRTLFGPGEQVVIGAGTRQGVQLDQRYVARRSADWAMHKHAGLHAINTTGRLRIVAVNETTAIASVEAACEAVMVGDYLVPYVEAALPPDMTRVDTSGDLDFGTPGRVLFGDTDKTTGGTGDFMAADIGEARGATPGARFAIYRDVQTAGVPIQPVGEAIVVFAGSDTSVLRLTLTRDAVRQGDLLIPRKAQ